MACCWQVKTKNGCGKRAEKEKYQGHRKRQIETAKMPVLMDLRKMVKDKLLMTADRDLSRATATKAVQQHIGARRYPCKREEEYRSKKS